MQDEFISGKEASRWEAKRERTEHAQGTIRTTPTEYWIDLEGGGKVGPFVTRREAKRWASEYGIELCENI